MNDFEHTVFVGGLITGAVVAVIWMTLMFGLSPPIGAGRNKQGGCELAGYSLVVRGNDRVTYCADLEDLVPYWEGVE